MRVPESTAASAGRPLLSVVRFFHCDLMLIRRRVRPDVVLQPVSTDDVTSVGGHWLGAAWTVIVRSGDQQRVAVVVDGRRFSVAVLDGGYAS